MTEREALIVLNAVCGLSNQKKHTLIDHFGSAKEVLALEKSKIDPEHKELSRVVSKIDAFPKSDFLKKEISLIEKHSVEIISYYDPNYPESLRKIDDAPVILYVKGDIERLSDFCIALVGSRRASIYGLSSAEKFAGDLSKHGFTIVSGMARGIDSSAHRGSLRNGGRTIAVLGCGMSHIYPPENKNLMEEIIKTGAVVSEFSMETPPVYYNFPRRNRIVSGLSMGVVVVEASKRSGALITSNCALEQGREVFAIPGKIDHPNSKGVNGLIQQGAKLACCVEDILDELGPQEKYFDSKKENLPNIEKSRSTELSSKEEELFGLINKRPIYVDELINKCNYTLSEVVKIVLNLQLKKLVCQLPGNYFIRTQ